MIVRREAKPRVTIRKHRQSATRVKAPGAGTLGKKTLEDDERGRRMTSVPANVKNSTDDDDDDIVGPPAKKGKASTRRLRNSKLPSSLSLRRVQPKTSGRGKTSNSRVKEKGKVRAGPTQKIIEPVEEDDDERSIESVSNPRNGEKEEDNYDDRLLGKWSNSRTHGTSFSISR
jgi:hypothetical protein